MDKELRCPRCDNKMVDMQACHMFCPTCGAHLDCSDKGNFWWSETWSIWYIINWHVNSLLFHDFKIGFIIFFKTAKRTFYTSYFVIQNGNFFTFGTTCIHDFMMWLRYLIIIRGIIVSGVSLAWYDVSFPSWRSRVRIPHSAFFYNSLITCSITPLSSAFGVSFR